MSMHFETHRIYKTYMRDAARSNIPKCAAAAAFLFFLSLTEARKKELDLSIVFDDQLETFVHSLANLPHTKRIDRKEFADIGKRRIEALGGKGALFEEFLISLGDKAIAEAAQLVGTPSIDWDEPAIAALSRLTQEALAAYGKETFFPGTPVMAQLVSEIAKRDGAGKRICVRWTGTGGLALAVQKAGLELIGFAHDAVAAALVAMLVALSTEKLVPADIRVGRPDPDDEFDYVLAAEDAWRFWQSASARRDTEGRPLTTESLYGDKIGLRTLEDGLRCAKDHNACMIGLTNLDISYGDRLKEKRKELLERGLDTVVEFGRGGNVYSSEQLISIGKPNRDASTPLFFAALNSEKAQKAGLDLSSYTRTTTQQEMDTAISAIAKLVVSQEERSYISKKLALDDVLASKDMSIRYSSYAESVDVAGSLKPELAWDELIEKARSSREEAALQEKAFSAALDALDTSLNS